jgi:hypothetical protein
MSDTNYKPDGTGVVMGDTKPMPDRGTTTGMTGYNTHGEGMGLGQDDTNSMGSITGSTGSDPWDECYVDDPTFGPAPGDKAEDAKERY